MKDDSDIVTLELTWRDLNEIKRLRLLATSDNNTYLLATNRTVQDMNANPLIPFEDGFGMRVGVFTPDTTPPDVLNTTLDMDSGLLIVWFSETVNLDTFSTNMDHITFYNSSLFDDPSYSLTNSRTSSQTHPTCLLYTSPSPRDRQKSRMPSSA